MMLISRGERDTTNPSNYRPISLLEHIGKILERINNEILQRHREDNEKQFEFRKRRGSQEVISLVSEFIRKMQANRKIINIVTRYVSKSLAQRTKIYDTNSISTSTTDYQTTVYYEGPAFDLESGIPQGSVQELL